MKLWKMGGDAGNPEAAVRLVVRDMVDGINRKTASRGVRVVNALRSSEMRILKGQRSGRVYKKPGTNGKANTVTRKLKKEYGHRLKGGQLYRASAPGEAPARRTGNLRLHWSGEVIPVITAGGIQIISSLKSEEKYSVYLEKGRGMEPRPFVEKIKEDAEPEIKRILSEPYT